MDDEVDRYGQPMNRGRLFVALRWTVAGLSTLGIATPVAGATILRGTDVVFFVVTVIICAGPTYLYAWLVRTPLMSVLLAIAYVALEVLLPIPGYRESFVTGAGAGGWLFWIVLLVGLPLAWLVFFVGWGVDWLVRRTPTTVDARPSDADPRRLSPRSADATKAG